MRRRRKIKKRIFRNKRNFKTIGTDEMSLKDEFYKKIVKNEDSEEFINWVMGVEDENELDNWNSWSDIVGSYSECDILKIWGSDWDG